MTGTDLLFVYGTLMRGQRNHHLLEDGEYLGPARTEPAFHLLDLGTFPALVPGGHTAVAGELYRVAPPTLALLDRIEGHPHFYRREEITLWDGQRVQAYVQALRRTTPGDESPRRTGASTGDKASRTLSERRCAGSGPSFSLPSRRWVNSLASRRLAVR